MNERLTIQDLTDLLSAKHNMSKKDAEAFVKEFFILIEQALENEKYIKVKGLGIFKLINVDSRESVNVNTGERFKIQGHSRISFTPDASLKEAINKPFSHFETVALNENTELESTPTDEEAENNAKEEEISVIVEKPRIEAPSTITNTEKTMTEESAKVIEEPADEEKETEEFATEYIFVKEEANTEMEETPEEEVTKEYVEQEKEAVSCTQESNHTIEKITEKKNPYVAYLTAAIFIILLLCGGMIFLIYYPDISSPSRKNTIDLPAKSQPALAMQTPNVVKDTISEVVSQELNQEEPQTIGAKEEKNAKTVYSVSVFYKITGTKTLYTIRQGETLTKVSLRFFGTKAMWPYIVKHNPEAIKDPDNVPFGTTIKIPELVEE